MNEFEMDGKYYVAQRCDGGCKGCAFEFDSKGCDKSPNCAEIERGVMADLIFVERHP